MEHFYHLSETNSAIDIGHVKVAEDCGSFRVEKQMSFKGLFMLLTSEGKPVFEPNAFILNRRIVEGIKDIKPTCFHLAKFLLIVEPATIRIIQR